LRSPFRKASKACREFRALPEILALKGVLELPDRLARRQLLLLAQRAQARPTLQIQGLQVQRCLILPFRKEFPALPEVPARKALPGQRGPRAVPELPDQQDPKAVQELPAVRAQPDRPE
jgi:hypothetical protein